MSRELNQTPFESLLPGSIARDETILAAARALDQELTAVNGLIDQVLIWSRLDLLEGEILDLLAHQLAVVQWAPDWSDSKKRQVVKMALSLHRKRGTPWAIEEAFRAANIDAAVTEWFEYGGSPYYFRVEVGVRDQGLDATALEAVDRIIGQQKNTRSHLDGVDIHLVADCAPRTAASCVYGEDIVVYPHAVTELQESINTGAALTCQVVDTVTVYPLT